jgi:hypothetical protein
LQKLTFPKFWNFGKVLFTGKKPADCPPDFRAGNPPHPIKKDAIRIFQIKRMASSLNTAGKLEVTR